VGGLVMPLSCVFRTRVGGAESDREARHKGLHTGTARTNVIGRKGRHAQRPLLSFSFNVRVSTWIRLALVGKLG